MRCVQASEPQRCGPSKIVVGAAGDGVSARSTRARARVERVGVVAGLLLEHDGAPRRPERGRQDPRLERHPAVRSSAAASATVTQSFTPSNERPLPNLPMAHDAPDDAADVRTGAVARSRPAVLVEAVGGHEPDRRRGRDRRARLGRGRRGIARGVDGDHPVVVRARARDPCRSDSSPSAARSGSRRSARSRTSSSGARRSARHRRCRSRRSRRAPPDRRRVSRPDRSESSGRTCRPSPSPRPRSRPGRHCPRRPRRSPGSSRSRLRARCRCSPWRSAARCGSPQRV